MILELITKDRLFKAMNSYYYKFFKHKIDFIASLIAIILLMPLLLIIVIVIKLDSKGSIFYIKKRLGKNEEVFEFYKFRTMTDIDRDQYVQIFQGDSQITRVGGFLRRTKFDELPQLFNVIKGDLSIVGPRPCLPNMKDKFGSNKNFRFKVKPGLTSLAAIKGSIYLTWEEKGNWDMEYVKNLSFLTDIKIIFNTIRVVLLGEKKLFENKI